MKNKVTLILALVCLLCSSATLTAQEVDAPEKPMAAKKAKGGKAKHATIMSAFGSAELTDEQKSQLSELISAKQEEMSTIRSEMGELVGPQDAKKIRRSVRLAMKDGAEKEAAQTAAWDEAGLSAEDQAKVAELLKQREAIEKGITSPVIATFSDEQKEAMKIPKEPKVKGKGKRKKGGKKGKKGKKSEDMEGDEA